MQGKCGILWGRWPWLQSLTRAGRSPARSISPCSAAAGLPATLPIQCRHRMARRAMRVQAGVVTGLRLHPVMRTAAQEMRKIARG